jgi:hypothetical protein
LMRLLGPVEPSLGSGLDCVALAAEAVADALAAVAPEGAMTTRAPKEAPVTTVAVAALTTTTMKKMPVGGALVTVVEDGILNDAVAGLPCQTEEKSMEQATTKASFATATTTTTTMKKCL